MGAADVVPGLSGGTVAFITGIYDELLLAIRSIDPDAVKLLGKFRVSEFWEKINGNFLVCLLAGIVTSLLTVARGIIYLLKHQPVLTRSFFFGLVMIAALLVLREIKHWNVSIILAFLTGTGIAYGLTVLSPLQAPDAIWFIFLTGCLCVCTLVIPGVSAVFILVVLEKYSFFMNAFTNFNLPIIFVFAAGCIVGILGFARFLSWMLTNYRNVTVALLAGFMLGSLNKVWPWREVLEYATNSRGEQIPAFDKSILPWHYFATTGKDPQVFQAILIIALGVFIVVLTEKIAVRLKTKI